MHTVQYGNSRGNSKAAHFVSDSDVKATPARGETKSLDDVYDRLDKLELDRAIGIQSLIGS